jgi:hypothetical protein
MTNPIRDSPRSSSSAAPMRATPAVLVLLLLALAAGRTDGCQVKVMNQYNVQLSLFAYNDNDISCLIPGDFNNVDAGDCKSIGTHDQLLGSAASTSRPWTPTDPRPACLF